jgi:hypothetical protein
MFFRAAIAFRAWFLFEIGNLVGPIFLGADALLGERFDSVTQETAAIVVRGAFDRAFVVVNKEPAKIDIRTAVLELEKLERADKRMRGARAELALILNRRTFFPQIHFRRQFHDSRLDCGVGEIAMIRQIGQPAVPLLRASMNFRWHLYLDRQLKPA